MKILIVSDSHGRHANLDTVIERVSPIDLMIHLGDFESGEDYLEAILPCPLEMVSGNNDYYTTIPREKIFTIGKYRVLLTHGHHYCVNYGLEMLNETARKNGVDIVMFGHTHKPFIDLTGDIMMINPGSVSQPRQEGRIPSYILMELDYKGQVHFTINYLS